MAVGDIVPVPGTRFEDTLESASPDLLREMIRRFAQRASVADLSACFASRPRTLRSAAGQACWAASMTPAMACRMRWPAWWGSGWSASSQAVIASMATTGAS